MAIDPSIYRGIDTQFGLKLADLFNPASIAQRQATTDEQTMSNQLRQMQIMQGVQQMKRAPVMAQREEQQYQAQQAEAQRVQQERAQKEAMFAQATPEQQKLLRLGVPAEKVFMQEQQKPSDVLAREKFEWEKTQPPKPIQIIQEMRAAGISETSPEGQKILRQRLVKPEGGADSQRGQIVFDNQGKAFNVNPYTNEVRPVEMGGQQIQGAQYSPGLQGQIAGAKVSGKETGEATAMLADMEASMPRLEVVVSELSNLGKKATYTMAGQAANAARRQLGMSVGEGAIARKEYISKVDNEILPLLRQTFGAQFTQKEGESLKATLGDPNASAEEKDAVLRSFIETKYGQIAGLKRRTGAPAQGGASGQWGIQRVK